MGGGVLGCSDSTPRDRRNGLRIMGASLVWVMGNHDEWLAFAAKTGLKATFITGDDLMKFAEEYEKLHIGIMKDQGWIK